MIMVDSSVWIDYFNGKECPEVVYLDAILGIKPVVIGDNILTEVLQGFKGDKDSISMPKGHGIAVTP